MRIRIRPQRWNKLVRDSLLIGVEVKQNCEKFAKVFDTI